MKDKAIEDAMNSIENRICHVYNQGYEDGIKDGKESVQIDETEAYKLGYENGLTCKEYVQIDESTAYKAGLEAAWELARKLSNLGYNDTRKEIFGEKYGLTIDIIKNFSVNEVEAKIQEYEEKQKQADDEIKVGDEVSRECGKTKRCRDCKYFEYDSVAKVDGIPLIVAHEICSKWGEGCKTNENGYCFLFEPKESEDKG